MLQILLMAFLYGLSFANNNHWAEGGIKQEDGASRDYYNLGAKLAWKNFLGDWIDATEMPQGLAPYSQAYIKDADSTQELEWDVTGLVKHWLSGKINNQGLFLHALAGKGDYHFRSREYERNPDEIRQLEILTVDGEQINIEPEADTYLGPDTYKSVGGKSETLILAGEPKVKNILISFPLNAISGKAVNMATLKMTSFAQYGSSNILIGVFRCDPGISFSETVQMGIAENYNEDKGIINHEDVIFATGFEKKVVERVVFCTI